MTQTNISFAGIATGACAVAINATDVDSSVIEVVEVVEVVEASVTKGDVSDLVSGMSRESAGTFTVQRTVRQSQNATCPPALLHAACCFSSSGKRPRLQARHGNFNSCAGELGFDKL